MTIFLFVTAAVALLAGFVGVVAGHVPRTMRRPQGPAHSWRPGHEGADGGGRARTGVGTHMERR
jgi:hypothetical protein